MGLRAFDDTVIEETLDSSSEPVARAPNEGLLDLSSAQGLIRTKRAKTSGALFL